MAAIMRWGRRLVQRPPSPPKQLKSSHFHSISASQLIEEETLLYYKAENFYPVRIGEIFNSEYQVLGKLGYGAYSTVWFCRDLLHHRYVAVKVYTQTHSQLGVANREVETYEHLSKLKSLHSGQAFTRGLYDTFKLNGPDGSHVCLVHPPLHMTIDALQRQGLSKRLNEVILREILYRLFQALDFLHTVANVVHTDVKATNIMLSIGDESMLNDFAKAEQDDPTPGKIINANRTIYCSRKFRFPKEALWGVPVLCDFGESRIGETHHGIIQPEVYRAPEVLFEMGWSYSVDIWNIWDLFENKHMFNALNDDQQYSPSRHVAEMVAYFGLPPPQYVHRSKVTREVFDDHGQSALPLHQSVILACSATDGKIHHMALTNTVNIHLGKWNRAGVEIPPISLEESEENLEGRNKDLFLQFMQSMLRWVPEERKSARELLDDPWLNERIE
ncbi:hypothetical protein MMC07_005133 [Pseudocyphellaria aurata]|nr:hypothetical protein [Pseudocyphellaria aurata]